MNRTRMFKSCLIYGRFFEDHSLNYIGKYCCRHCHYLAFQQYEILYHRTKRMMDRVLGHPKIYHSGMTTLSNLSLVQVGNQYRVKGAVILEKLIEKGKVNRS